MTRIGALYEMWRAWRYNRSMDRGLRRIRRAIRLSKKRY